MKRFLLLAVSICLATTLFAQSESEHLTFKGVPIDGTLDEFVANMKSAGFSYLGEDDGTAILKGDFAGNKGCTIGVYTLQGMDLVSQIGVIFPERKEWSVLERDYNSLKAALTEKYGKPSEVVEEFEREFMARDSSGKFHELLYDSCTWFTTFSTDKGDIQLRMGKFSYTSAVVILIYKDKINSQQVKSAAMDDL